MQIFILISHILFLLALGFYLITALQWFSYKFQRIVFHFTKPLWHLWFLILPIVLYFGISTFSSFGFFIFFYVIYLPALFLWHKKLDKKLVFTSRVKRFFVIFLFAAIFIDILMIQKAQILPIFLPLFLAFIISFGYEKYQAMLFKKSAQKKLENNPNLTIIQITASYGKTSIKNFLFQVLKDDFICYKTPRSVNTLNGLIKDINENLEPNTQIYIAEAGARLAGDIDEITQFLRPQIVVVGEIGAQHIEYFKTIENIRATKLEALNSTRLKMAFLHSSTQKEKSKNVEIYDLNLSNVCASLEGTTFDMKFDKIYSFKAPILGDFNAWNLAVCVCVARYLELSFEKIQKQISKIKSVEHRLEKIEAGGKLIIDDSFNGNFSGMSKSYELARSYQGRKVIITPGIVESTQEENEKLAKIINDIFDLVMVTSDLNAATFEKIIDKNKLIMIKDKSKMTEILAKETKVGDLVLFSNDAPNFI
ncbi:Mur ligase family protein [Campylobacter geochelonis]|uniref:Mur ligase middle domain-containing protein n=1 Tax=Campylobacter geochelonis TaxID=1780362 RepID=A0A128EGZ3_9BACT|nr:UDP-N-acetylmuramoyl-tripeptide--D-alanyl-D-alanine ligase [Campylobacter geochelonis]QKF71319.1 D-alanyl-D-alanine-adding enzyme [Campylobacter geochelonis]CZE48199.1 Mur ligase middle domain-containing protein [Campylobacter geochelonis]